MNAPPSGQSAAAGSATAPEIATFRPPLSVGGNGGDEDSLAHYVAALWRHPRLLLATPVLFAAIVGATMLSSARTYVAHAAFVPSESSGNSGTAAALGAIASQFGIPGLSSLTSLAGGGASVSPQFYGDLLTSNAMLHAVVTTNYDASAVVGGGGRPYHGTLLAYLKARGPTPTDREIDAMKKFAHSTLVVTVDRPTSIVHFDVRTRNRQLSALIARRILDLVNEFNLQRRQSQAAAESEFDGKRAKAAADTLRAAEAALAAFRATNIDYSRSPVLTTRESELQRQVTLAQQVYTTIAQRYEMAAMEAVRNTPVVTVLDAPEGLVETKPRYAILLTVAGAAFGLAVAGLAALWMERRTLPA